jgi:hypothetical protein
MCQHCLNICLSLMLKYSTLLLQAYLLVGECQPSHSETDWLTDSCIHSSSHSWSRVVLEKLIVTQLVNKFPTFYGTFRFIIMFTRAHHLSLSWARWVWSVLPHPISERCILISSFHLHLGIQLVSFLQVPYRYVYAFFAHTCPTHLLFLDLVTWIAWSSASHFVQRHVTSTLLVPNILLSTLFLNTFNVFSLKVRHNFHICLKQEAKLQSSVSYSLDFYIANSRTEDLETNGRRCSLSLIWF